MAIQNKTAERKPSGFLNLMAVAPDGTKAKVSCKIPLYEDNHTARSLLLKAAADPDHAFTIEGSVALWEDTSDKEAIAF